MKILCCCITIILFQELDPEAECIITNKTFLWGGSLSVEYELQKFVKLNIESKRFENLTFSECEFDRCEFFENVLKRCTFKNCTFRKCVIVNNAFEFTTAAGNRFEGCTIIGLNWDKITQPHVLFMPFEKFENCVLKYNVFYKLKLKKMDLHGCDLQGSFFEECDLTEADFRDCNLAETVFTNANLMKADFRGAKNYVISPQDNRVRKAKFSFPEVLSLLKCLEIEIE